MNQKNLPSWQIGAIVGTSVAAVHLIVNLLSQQGIIPGLLETIFLAGISFLLTVFILEKFVYQRILYLTEQREKEIERLKNLETFRREFIGDVSHELKTPIFAIEGFIETLLDGAMEDKKVNRKFLQKALKHAERLANLVQDILVITQVESGDLSMRVNAFSIYALLQETIDSLDNKFTKKGRNIECVLEGNGIEEVLAMGEKERIEQVVYNLIDNAVKYGDANGTIKISLENYTDDKLLIKVKDNGPGIEPEHMSRLFQRFYRVDKSRSREKGGTGLGLAICKHLMEAHNQKIWVESEIDKGTVFQFTLQKAV